VFEKASREVVVERERTAARVRDELVAAGLGATGSSAVFGMLLGQGPEVTVDEGDDAAGGVVIRWQCHPVLRRRAMDAFAHGASGDTVFAHHAAVRQAMLAAITTVLASAGFEVVDNPDDMDPLTLRVVSAPDRDRALTWELPPAGSSGAAEA
jgi:hypothetical protein